RSCSRLMGRRLLDELLHDVERLLHGLGRRRVSRELHLVAQDEEPAQAFARGRELRRALRGFEELLGRELGRADSEAVLDVPAEDGRETDAEASERALLDEVHGDEPAKVLPGDLVGSGRGRSRARPAPEIEKRAGDEKKSATRRRGDPDVHPRALALRSLAEDVAWSRDLE